MNNETESLGRLQVGHVITLDREEYLIVMVNSCRARAVPRQKRTVTVKPLAGEAVTFQRHAAALNISPNSECEILGYDDAYVADAEAKADAKALADEARKAALASRVAAREVAEAEAQAARNAAQAAQAAKPAKGKAKR